MSYRSSVSENTQADNLGNNGSNGNGKNRKSTDKRLLNLRPPWKPGESGNKTGYRPGAPKQAKTFTELCKAYGAEPDPDNPGRTRLDTLKENLWRASEEGDTKAARLVLERIDPALQRHTVESIAAGEGNAIVERLLRDVTLPVPTNGTNGNGNGNGH